MFNDSINSSFTLSFGSWTTHRKVVNNSVEFQVDIGSAHKINRPKYIIAAHQSLARKGTSNEANYIAIFDNIDVLRNFCDIDGIRHPKDSIIIKYDANEYLDRYRDFE